MSFGAPALSFTSHHGRGFLHTAWALLAAGICIRTGTNSESLMWEPTLTLPTRSLLLTAFSFFHFHLHRDCETLCSSSRRFCWCSRCTVRYIATWEWRWHRRVSFWGGRSLPAQLAGSSSWTLADIVVSFSQRDDERQSWGSNNTNDLFNRLSFENFLVEVFRTNQQAYLRHLPAESNHHLCDFREVWEWRDRRSDALLHNIDRNHAHHVLVRHHVYASLRNSILQIVQWNP